MLRVADPQHLDPFTSSASMTENFWRLAARFPLQSVRTMEPGVIEFVGSAEAQAGLPGKTCRLGCLDMLGLTACLHLRYPAIPAGATGYWPPYKRCSAAAKSTQVEIRKMTVKSLPHPTVGGFWYGGSAASMKFYRGSQLLVTAV